jgi:hypothetical protein
MAAPVPVVEWTGDKQDRKRFHPTAEMTPQNHEQIFV